MPRFGETDVGHFGFGRTLLTAAALCACTVSHASAPGMEISTGMASYYADRFTGKATASGEAYDPDDFTAAHRTLAFGTRVRVTDVASGRSVVVRVNDRGPWGGKRVIDISRAAARALGMIGRGHGQVRLARASDDAADGARAL
jgi:rare lipoprotein A